MDVHELKDRARALVVKGRLEKAEVLYRQVVTLVPGDAPAWIRHAETLKRLSRVSEAVWSYRTASSILRALGHEGRALACLKLALELKPDDIDLITEIIRIEMHRKRRLERLPYIGQGRDGTASVPIADLQRPKLALPMLTEVDPRQLADSIVMQVPGSTPTESAIAHESAPRANRVALQPPELDAASQTSAAVEQDAAAAQGAGADGAEKDAAAPVVRGTPAPAVELEVQLAQMPVWPQVRRIHDREVAIKAGPASKWLVVSSSSPLDVRFETSLAIDEDAPWLE